MYKKYTNPPCPPVECGVVERHLEKAQAITKKSDLICKISKIIFALDVCLSHIPIFDHTFWDN